jgi:integrase
MFREYAREFWRDYSRHWRPATKFKNKRVLSQELLPTFGRLRLGEVRRSDVIRWRDGLAARPGVFNRALPVLAVMMSYAERLGYRPRGSNPARRIPRFKRTPMERFLSDREYRRLAKVLDEAPASEKLAAAAIRLLLYTGARRGEIRLLRWDQVRDDRLILQDSKTGPKTIYLNAPARAVLRDLFACRTAALVFPAARSKRRPMTLDPVWLRIRRRALLPDVRLHDLRHSFASIAIRNGMSLNLIGRLLGHALPETTARYAHLADDAILDAADRVCSSLVAALAGVQ